MSDQSQGPGWWQASDGKWYPPEQAPAQPTVPPPTQPVGTAPPAAGPAPTRSGLGTGPIIAIVVAAVAIIGAIVFFATKDDGNKKNAAATQSSSSSSKSSSSSSRSSSSSSKSTSSSGAPKITAPSGFKVFSNDDDRFAIAIPERLTVIDLTAADLDQVLQQLSDNNPQLAKLAPQIKNVFQSGGKLFAIDASDASGFNDNVSIISTPGSIDVTSPSTKSQAEEQLSSVQATNVDLQTETFNGRDVLVSSYQASVNNADGTAVTFFGRQALVSTAGQIWFITFSSGADDASAFRTMLGSFDVSG